MTCGFFLAVLAAMTRTKVSGERPEAGSLGHRIRQRIKYEDTGPVNHQMIPTQVQLLCQNSNRVLLGKHLHARIVKPEP